MQILDARSALPDISMAVLSKREESIHDQDLRLAAPIIENGPFIQNDAFETSVWQRIIGALKTVTSRQLTEMLSFTNISEL